MQERVPVEACAYPASLGICRGKTEKPSRGQLPRCLLIIPRSLTFPEGAGQEPSSSFLEGPKQNLQLKGASTLLALTQTLTLTPTSAPTSALQLPPQLSSSYLRSPAHPGLAMDSTTKDGMQPALLPGMSPTGRVGRGMWQERWEWWGWSSLPGLAGALSVSGQREVWTALGARLRSRKGSRFGSCFLRSLPN